MMNFSHNTSKSPPKIDRALAKRLDPYPISTKDFDEMRRNAANFIRQQRVSESKMSKTGIQERREEIALRRNLDDKMVEEIKSHPLWARMLKAIAHEMIEEEHRWRRYRRHELWRDTETSRRRIQSEISELLTKYALKYNKRPWRNPGISKIKTKFFEDLDWVQNPFDVVEENTEHDTKHESVKT